MIILIIINSYMISVSAPRPRIHEVLIWTSQKTAKIAIFWLIFWVFGKIIEFLDSTYWLQIHDPYVSGYFSHFTTKKMRKVKLLKKNLALCISFSIPVPHLFLTPAPAYTNHIHMALISRPPSLHHRTSSSDSCTKWYTKPFQFQTQTIPFKLGISWF